MANVTYLIGAGASAGKRTKDGWIIEGLPVVNEITGRLREYVDGVRNATFPIDMKWTNQYLEMNDKSDWEYARQRLLYNLDYLYRVCRNNATIDTYAKKLVLQGKREDLEHLERMLAFFFVSEQVLCAPDSRYDTFLANILQDKRQFPENINVLSWNYDSQFEIAYHEYDVENQLRIGSKMSQTYQPFDILKINGSATFRGAGGMAEYRKALLKKMSKNSSEYSPFGDPNKYDVILPDLIALFKLYVGEINPTKKNTTNLSFAFDYNRPSEVLYQRSDEIIRSTDVLVIIGYTFPFFNRIIDRRILASLPMDATIYIQDIHPERIQQSLQAVCPEMKESRIYLLNEVDQFFLPPQL